MSSDERQQDEREQAAMEAYMRLVERATALVSVAAADLQDVDPDPDAPPCP